MCCRYGAVLHIVADSGEETGAETLHLGHLVEEGGGGGFAVGSGDAYQFEMLRGMVIPCRCETSESFGRVGHFDICYPLLNHRGEVFAHDSAYMIAGYDGDIFMAVGGHTAHGNKHSALGDFARIALKADYILVGLSDYLYGTDFLQKVGQFYYHNLNI